MTEIIGSAVAGTAVASMLFRMLIYRSLQDLQNALKKIEALAIQLASITTKIELMDRDTVMLREHDRKIATLEASLSKKKG